MIKDCDEQLRFVFLTGVSKLAGIFSANLNDITLDERYGDICGYTDAELDAVFAPELEGLDREKVRRWYDGYSWLGPERVYNPHDILMLFDKRRFRPYWFQSGTPAFLADLLAHRRVAAPDLEGLIADDGLLSTIDIDRIPVEALLFQTGYLTVAGEKRDEEPPLYRLDYPNHEVKRSLNALLLQAMAPDAAVEAENLRRADERLRRPRAAVPGVPVYLICTEFGREERNIVGFEKAGLRCREIALAPGPRRSEHLPAPGSLNPRTKHGGAPCLPARQYIASRPLPFLLRSADCRQHEGNGGSVNGREKRHGANASCSPPLDEPPENSCSLPRTRNGRGQRKAAR